jgi:hypothetical protein
MARTYLVFGDVEGKLDMLRATAKLDRSAGCDVRSWWELT